MQPWERQTYPMALDFSQRLHSASLACGPDLDSTIRLTGPLARKGESGFLYTIQCNSEF